MKTLQIDEMKAKQFWKTGTSELKAILEDTFGKSFFSEKITDRVKTFEDARKRTIDYMKHPKRKRKEYAKDAIKAEFTKGLDVKDLIRISNINKEKI